MHQVRTLSLSSRQSRRRGIHSRVEAGDSGGAADAELGDTAQQKQACEDSILGGGIHVE